MSCWSPIVGGGYPVTGAARRLTGRVSGVVYYNAVVPQRGQAMSDENVEMGHMIRALMAASADQALSLPIEAVRQGLMKNASPEMQDLVHSLTLPQPGGYMVEALDVPTVAELGLPATYLLGLDDTSLARPGAEFAGRIGVAPVLVPGDHMAMLTHPEIVADVLSPA